MAEHLIDEAVFGDHPLGRPVLGPAEHIRDTFTREGIVAFRARRWSPARGGAFAVGNLDSLRRRRRARASSSAASTRVPSPQPYEPAPAVRAARPGHERDSNQSHLRMSYRPDDRRRRSRASARR